MQVEGNIKQESTEDWIDYIVDVTLKNYSGRDVVIWGKCETSECISDNLKKHGLDTAFYVESNEAKIDDRQVFSPDCLPGKSNKYYVVIPLAYYQSFREKLIWGGIHRI